MGYIGAGITRFNTADELTVTGDAQIDTTTLVVDSTNNRVGMGNASPATALDVTGTVTADGLTVDGNKVGISNAAPASVRSSDTIINMQDSFITVGSTNINLSHNVFHNGTNWVRSTTDSVGHLQVANNQLNFFNSTSDTAGTTVSFTKRMNINGGGDISFFADNGTTQGLYWDASTQRLGLGTTSPATALDLAGEINFSGLTSSFPSPSQPRLYRSGSSAGSYPFNNFGHLVIQARGDGSNRDIVFATGTAGANKTVITSGGNVGIGTTSPSKNLHVYHATTNRPALVESGDADALLEFKDSSTTNAPAVGATGNSIIVQTGSSSAERMRIDSSGNLLVGKTSVDYTTVGFEATPSSGFQANAMTADGKKALLLARKTSDGDIVEFRKDSTEVGSINTEGGRIAIGTGDTGLYFNDGGDALVGWNISANTSRGNAIDLGTSGVKFKDLYLSGGVYLGGTGSANKLDDYEEGTFVPVLNFGGGTTGITYSSQVGIYTKVGRKVTVTINIALTNKGTSTGNAGISMPFASASIGYEQGHHQPYLPGVTVDGRVTHYIGSGTTNTQLVDQNDAGGTAFIDDTNFVNTSIIRSTIIYFTA
jgi:hypothetical protein